MFLTKTPLKIVATLLAKNEEDIIQKTIEHHLENGISQIIFTDNASTDGTRQIVEKYKEVVEMFDEIDNTHNQSKSVNRMLKVASRLKPNWIVHLDADELWGGLSQLSTIKTFAAGAYRNFIHPPRKDLKRFDLNEMRHYLNLENIPNLGGECKVIHRPDENVEVTHGNHGFVNVPFNDITFTKLVYRHHYPIRSYEQFERKTVQGHEALLRRGAPCPRWSRWYSERQFGQLAEVYGKMVQNWEEMLIEPTMERMTSLLEIWSETEVIELMQKANLLPIIGQWPQPSCNNNPPTPV